MKAELPHSYFLSTVLARKTQELYGRWSFYLFIEKINKKKYPKQYWSLLELLFVKRNTKY